MLEIVMVHGTPCVALSCRTCGVWHTIPEAVYRTCKAEGGYWFCPNGHHEHAKDAEQPEGRTPPETPARRAV